ncbi:MAG: cupin domain-containing protein [Deltaproteobacteria bacterium]|nr:cupin domain-containing protein [Deltaproteobacteria bacterium]
MKAVRRLAWSVAGEPRESTLRARLAADGFEVTAWSDPPGRTYAPHRHDHDESLWCVRGCITFHIAGRAYRLNPGDRLMLPRGTLHGATVGSAGAAYLIGERRAALDA